MYVELTVNVGYNVILQSRQPIETFVEDKHSSEHSISQDYVIKLLRSDGQPIEIFVEVAMDRHSSGHSISQRYDKMLDKISMRWQNAYA